MRFMMLGRADKNTEAGVLPSEELVAPTTQTRQLDSQKDE